MSQQPGSNVRSGAGKRAISNERQQRVMSFLIPHRSRRHGMTLTELLVVISIIVLVAGAFVPMLQPLTRGRRVR